jgi:hypothetical protein
VRALQYERKEENMNKKRTIFTAVILGEAAVGLAPMTAWLRRLRKKRGSLILS